MITEEMKYHAFEELFNPESYVVEINREVKFQEDLITTIKITRRLKNENK